MKYGTLAVGRILIGAIVLLCWQCGSYLLPRLDFALSRPTEVAIQIVSLLRDVATYRHIAATGGAALVGLCLGSFLGTALGLLTWSYRSASELLRPFVLALSATPILAVAPLMIIWFGIGIQMKVALACLSTIFVAFGQASRGAANVSQRYLDVLQGMKASNKQIFVMAIVPGSLDWVFSGMRINAGLALLGTFIGEFIASDMGLGYLVLRASSLYDVPRALAASTFIMLVALIFDALAAACERRRKDIIRMICVPRNGWSPAI